MIDDFLGALPPRALAVDEVEALDAAREHIAVAPGALFRDHDGRLVVAVLRVIDLERGRTWYAGFDDDEWAVIDSWPRDEYEAVDLEATLRRWGTAAFGAEEFERRIVEVGEA